MDLFLGRRLDDASRLGLPAERLVTHGVILGMTGSGKTGLGLALLEELASQGIPLILIDPKGDLPNLGLLFPAARAGDLAPWLESGQDPEQVAEQLRGSWEEWGVNLAWREALAARVDLRVYTPGSRAGLPVNVLGRMSRPSSGFDRELVTGTVSGLLSLVGVQADPVRSPEHVVLSQILEAAWNEAQELTLEGLILKLVDPPFKKVGVFPVDTFYPPEQRLKLAMLFNAVLASPAFADWTSGAYLDPETLCAPQDARTPVSIFYLAHLSDAERMFFVSLLLERVVAWTRRLSGSSRLRALIFFDEASGYLPPHPRDPASKKPIMTLLKQARAVGLGVVLATQNPVDLDYKALANAGTWLIGRMQTAQDRERVADGMLTAGTGSDRSRLLEMFGQLRSRVFALKTADAEQPVLFSTRQTACLLRGPLTLADVTRVSSHLAVADTLPAEPVGIKLPSSPPPPASLPEGLFLDPAVVFSARLEGGFEPFALPRREDGRLLWQAALHAELQLRFDEDKGDFVLDERQHRVSFPPLSPSRQLSLQPGDLLAAPPEDGLFEEVPALDLKAAQAALVAEVFAGVSRSQWVHTGLKLYGAGGETRESFVARCEEAIRDRIDVEVARLQTRFAREVGALEERIHRHRARLSQLETAAQDKQADQLLHAGEMILGFFTGNKRKLSGVLTKQRASTTARSRAEQAADELGRLESRMWELQERLQSEVAEIERREREAAGRIEARSVRLDRGDVQVLRFGLLWVPVTRRV